jgi:hypothetical protein
LLKIEHLLEIVKVWDKLVRSQLGQNALWYTNLSTDGLCWSQNLALSQSEVRRKSFRRGLLKLCAMEISNIDHHIKLGVVIVFM